MSELFLHYLTVFRSRLGTSNIVLGLSSFAHQSEAGLTRKIRKVLETKVELDVAPANHQTFAYLREKRLVSENFSKKGRYQGFSLIYESDAWKAYDKQNVPLEKIPVFKTDLWLSHPDVPSTIGVPTPDNADELVHLSLQYHIIAKSKNTWTSEGQVIATLRGASQAIVPDPDNPFLLGYESLALMRQAIKFDGLIIRELLRSFPAEGTFSRDDVARNFGSVVAAAVSEARRLSLPAPLLRNARQFQKLIEETSRKRDSQSRAPGVLEHRVSPRLEWLVDLGFLSKSSLPKNGFDYRVLPEARSFLEDLDSWVQNTYWAENVVTAQAQRHAKWHPIKRALGIESRERRFPLAYSLLRKSIGPSSLADVAFVAALCSDGSYDDTVREIMDFANNTKGVELSGGRYQRTAQNIFMSDDVLTSM